jgi:hypothetical protein
LLCCSCRLLLLLLLKNLCRTMTGDDPIRPKFKLRRALSGFTADLEHKLAVSCSTVFTPLTSRSHPAGIRRIVLRRGEPQQDGDSRKPTWKPNSKSKPRFERVLASKESFCSTIQRYFDAG